MGKPVISVIVPLYKAEGYIEKCLRSIMAQTLRDIEIICADDCSPDGSADVVARLAEEDARITLIRHETNRGPGAARNSAIRAARADFVASVDSDDYVDPDFLEQLWHGSDHGYYDVTICGYCRVRPDGSVINRPMQGRKLVLDPIPKDQNPIRISGPEVWNKLWRRSLFVDNDIWFPDHIYHQDSATTPLLYMKARNARFIGGSPYKYLIREGSITQTTSDKHMLDRFRCMDVLKDFILRDGSYERLKEALDDRIYSGYAYHVGNVVKNRLGGDAATDTYLRHLLIMREAYLEHDMTVRAMSLEEKADYLINHRPLPRRGPPGGSGAEPGRIAARAPLPESPKLLVLTRHDGETEFEAGRAALEAQTHPDWQQRVFRSRPRAEAEAAIRRSVMDHAGEFDLFVVMGADTVPARPETLAEIIGIFRENPTLDHLVLACDDALTGQRDPGVEVFSNRVTWADRDAGDRGARQDPVLPGTRLTEDIPGPAGFLRNSEPSGFQAFHFGARLALELSGQLPGENPWDAATLRAAWQALSGLWAEFSHQGDRRRALALVAADLVLEGQLTGATDDPGDPALQAAFEAHALQSGADLAEHIRPRWENAQARRACLERALALAGPPEPGLAETILTPPAEPG